MNKEDIQKIRELAEEIRQIGVWRLREVIEELGGLLEKVAEGKKLEIGEDVCCRTCRYWRPAGEAVWGSGKDEREEYTRETAPMGWCSEPGNEMHDNTSPPDFFCSTHPFFKR